MSNTPQMSQTAEMESEAQEYRRASLRQMNPVVRKSVNWAHRHPSVTDAGGPPADGANGADGAGGGVGREGDWREGALSPLGSTVEYDAYHYYSTVSSTAGGGTYSSRYGSRYGGLSRSVSATTGVGSSRTSEAWEGGGVPYERSASTAGRAAVQLSSSGAAPSAGYASGGGSLLLPVAAGVTSRPGTSDPYGAGGGYDRYGTPPGTPGSPSKVGLSARQRAMVDSSQFGTFRFARIKRAATPTAAVAAAAGAVHGLDGDDAGVSASASARMLPGVVGGGGAGRTPSMRVAGNVATAAAAFQSPLAPYRRAAAPLPAANYRTSQAGGGGGSPVPSPSTAAIASAIMQELNARQIDPPDGAAAAAAASARGASPTRFDDQSVASEAVSALPPNVTRTEVLANFVRPGRGAIVQPGLQKMPASPELEVSEAEALLGSAAGGAPGGGPGGGGAAADAFDAAAASSALVDAELAPLLREVAEINVRPAVRAALSKLDDRAIKQLFSATSRRVEHLPCTPVSLSSGGGLLMPLPGPKGVPGYRVNIKGQVHPTRKATGHFFSSNSVGWRGAAASAHSTAEAAPVLLELLDQDPGTLSPKTRALLLAHAPSETLDILGELERGASPHGSGGGGGGAGGSPTYGVNGGRRRSGGTQRSGSSPRRRSVTGEHPNLRQSQNGAGRGYGHSQRGAPGSPPHSPHASFSQLHPLTQPQPHGHAHAHAHGHGHGHGHSHLHPAHPQSAPHPHHHHHQQHQHHHQQHQNQHRISATGAAPAAAAAGGGGGGGGSHPDPRCPASVHRRQSLTASPNRTERGGGGDAAAAAAAGGRQTPSPRDLRFKLGKAADGGGGGGSSEMATAFALGSGGAAAAAAIAGVSEGGGARSRNFNHSTTNASSSNNNSGNGDDPETDDPLEARRWRLGRMMAAVETEKVPDEVLRGYAQYMNLTSAADAGSLAALPDPTAPAATVALPPLLDRRTAAGDSISSRHSSIAAAGGASAATGAKSNFAAAAAAAAADAAAGTGAGTNSDVMSAAAAAAAAAGQAATEAAPTAAAAAAVRLRKLDFVSWAGAVGGADDSAEEPEEKEDELVTDQELGLLTLDQTLAQMHTTSNSALLNSDALLARMEHGVKRKAALAARRAFREAEARRLAEEE
ncbi:hypothetical protein PLESTM_000586100, partial [Pleodorina starrii]